jgi:23S rRNA pseudouridine2605 synthase
MRLAAYIARCGVASRRHAERLISSGRVRVAGELVRDPAFSVEEGANVTVDGRAISFEPHEHYVLNKPQGAVSTAHDPEGRKKVTDLVRSRARLYPVGRLDADTTGLMLLTNDGELANRLMHPRYEVPKTYCARVAGAVSERELEALRTGVELEDGRTAPAKARALERSREGSVLELVIHQGRKRQVRRMCEAIGHPVLALERVRYGPLVLGDLAPGKARPLSAQELADLRRAAGMRESRP